MKYVFLMLVGVVSVAATVGQKAPAFSAVDILDQKQSLDGLKGKTVVLEWHNQNCPFVKKHYESGNMQRLQNEWTKKGVAWITVISSAPGKQGFVTAEEEKAYLGKTKANPTAVILDSEGTIGTAYGAKTTPHMFVIDPKGVLAYNGALDDQDSTDATDIPKAKNYVAAALAEIAQGKPVSTPATSPYGCGVKYK